jgi:hypothetical protein
VTADPSTRPFHRFRIAFTCGKKAVLASVENRHFYRSLTPN